MYAGYRLKINGVVYPNSNILLGSYSAMEDKRIVEIWKDANQVEHEVTTGTTKAVITFSIRQHSLEEHDDLVEALRPEHDLQIEYWSDLYGEYRTGVFRRDKIRFHDLNTSGGSIQYDAAQVTLTED